MADINYKTKKLSDFPRGLWEAEVVEADWECAPCGMTRDSDALTRANFDAMCDRFDTLDPYGNDWEIVRFGHFGVGWLEAVFVRPGSPVAALCPDIRTSMAAYPCLDEALWGKYEDEERNA